MILRFCEGGVLDVGLTTVADSLAYGMHGKLTVLRASSFIAEIPRVHRGALSGCLQGRCEIYVVFSCFLAFLLWFGISPLGILQCGQLVVPCQGGRVVHLSLSWCFLWSVLHSGLKLLSTLSVRALTKWKPICRIDSYFVKLEK